MPDIVLTTINAKYIHAAFGLRYLLVNLGPLRSRARLLEFQINQRPVDIVEALLAEGPRIIGLGVYIWNVTPATEVVALLKRVRPDIIIVLGGPEVSHETEQQEIVRLADHVITGEADLRFAELCKSLLERCSPTRSADHCTSTHCQEVLGPGREPQVEIEPSSKVLPIPKIITAPLPEFSQIALPYDLYDEADIGNRIVYVEASRGCPFTCEFCLSSLDVPVRQADLPAFLEAMRRLLDRGLRQFKFVDRTFNLHPATSRAILEFFLSRHRPGNFYHFEMIPDRLPAELRKVVRRFPAGALQFEVGIQTFNPEVAERIRRRQNYDRLEDNLRFLRNETGVHIHADLVAGLPGESVESFAAGFDRLIALRPQEIQVGLLKRLRGTPITRHDTEWQMKYNPQPPYEVLQTKTIDFATMQQVRRFARYWDLVSNSGNFIETTPMIWSGPIAPASRGHDGNHSDAARPAAGDCAPDASPFDSFLKWSEWLHKRSGRTDGIALGRLMEWLFEFLTTERQLDPKQVAGVLARDYVRGGRRDVPHFLRELVQGSPPLRPMRSDSPPRRQARHLAARASV